MNAEVIGNGRGTPAVRGDGYFEMGREGLRPGPGIGENADVGHGDDLGRDDQSDPGVA